MSEIITGIGSILTFILSQFGTFFDLIQEHPLLLFFVLLGSAGSIISLVFYIFRKVGVRARG